MTLDPRSASSLLDDNFDAYVHTLHILSRAPLTVTAPFTFAFSALSMSCTDDICHIAVEAMELESHLPHLLTNRSKYLLSFTRLPDTFLKYN